MKSVLLPQRAWNLQTIWSVRAARIFRMFRDYYPGAGLPLAACVSLLRRRGPDALPVNNQPRSILVIRLDAMGDLIMTTPILRELKENYPGAKITALVQQGNQEILETNPFVDRIIVLPPTKDFVIFKRSGRALSIVRLYWKHLHGEHFDIALQPRLGPDYFGANLLLMLVSASSRVKYKDDLRGLSRYLARIAYRSMTSLPRPALQHEVLSNMACVGHLTHRTGQSGPDIFLTEGDQLYAKHFLEGTAPGASIVCVAFGAQAARRQWPLECWAETIRLLARSRKVKLVILCSRAEAFKGDRLQSMLRAIPGLDSRILIGANLREVAGCVKACDLLLGADSGLAHLAAAVGCNTLVVSPHPADGDPHHENSPLRFKPYSHQACVLQPATSRYPCRSGCDAVAPHCILEIEPGQLAKAAERMLWMGRSGTLPVLRSEAAYQREGLFALEAIKVPPLHGSIQSEC